VKRAFHGCPVLQVGATEIEEEEEVIENMNLLCSAS
jgi:hypothetical protein